MNLEQPKISLSYGKLYKGIIKTQGKANNQDAQIQRSIRCYIFLLIGSFVTCWAPFHITKLITGVGIDVEDDQCDLINQMAYG